MIYELMVGAEIIKEVITEYPRLYNFIVEVFVPLIISFVPAIIVFFTTRSQIKDLERSLPFELKKIQKEKTIDKMVKSIEFFTDAVLDTEKVMKQKDFQPNLEQSLKDVVIYGNEKSVYFASQMMQYNFTQPSPKEIDKLGAEEKLFRDPKTAIIIYSLMVSYLKHDLIGEWVSPHTIMKIKINDYSELESTMYEVESLVKKQFNIEYDNNGPK